MARMSIIFKDAGLWYFWNDSWTSTFGPYNTMKEAEAGFKDYTGPANTPEEKAAIIKKYTI